MRISFKQLYYYIRRIMRMHRNLQRYMHKRGLLSCKRKERRAKDGTIFWGCGL